MKKIISALCALVLGLGISACGTNTGGTDDPDTPPDTPPTSYDYTATTQKDTYDAAFTDALLGQGDLDFTLSQLSGTDAGGRQVKTVSERKPNKYVGIFYFMWLGEGWNYIYDISKLLEKNPDLKYDTLRNPLWAVNTSAENAKYYDPSVSPMHAFHYFEEPFYGYYNSWDTWVIRRHLELLTAADIDFLYLDFTNANAGGANLYKRATTALLDTILQMQSEGYDVPRIVPMCCNNTQSIATIKNVVQWVRTNYYEAEDGKYKNCWFYADAEHNPSRKPLIAIYNDGKNEVKNSAEADCFWVRNVVWPSAPTLANTADGFPWMDWEQPQRSYGGVMNVSVAQHLQGRWSSEAYLAQSRNDTQTTYRGRGATYMQKKAIETGDEEAANWGANFVDQWKDAIDHRDVWMVNVTGWNEWVAQKYTVSDPKSDYAMFVDTFSKAYSRDIEMMRDDGYADNYWMLLCKYVREFKYGKGTHASEAAMWQTTTIDYTDPAAWDAVRAKYIDFGGDAKVRNSKSVGDIYTYTDTSARNDVDYVKLCNDARYLYAFVKTKGKLTAHAEGDKGWMNLYISTGAKDGWENYDFLVNRFPENGKTSVERLRGTTKNIQATRLDETADIATGDDWISYRIPLSSLGLTAGSEIGVKVADNIFANTATKQNDGVCVFAFGDVMAFYGGGDCAPIGRLNYTYRLAYPAENLSK